MRVGEFRNRQVDLVAEELSDLSTLVSREQKREREAKPSIAR